MNTEAEIAEQAIRIAMQGASGAIRLSGRAAAQLAGRLHTALAQPRNSAGRKRLSSMLKSGKMLSVFELKNQDLKIFSREAKRYGIRYCVLRDRSARPEDTVDIIVQTEDAPRIGRICSRYALSPVVSEPETENPMKAGIRNEDRSARFSARTGTYPLPSEQPAKPSVRKEIRRILASARSTGNVQIPTQAEPLVSQELKSTAAARGTIRPKERL